MKITTSPGEAFLPEVKAGMEALIEAEPSANCLAVLLLLAPVVESCINRAYRAGHSDGSRREEERFKRGDPGHPDNEMGM